MRCTKERILVLQKKTLYQRIRLYRSGADSNPSCAGKGAFVGQEGSAKKFPNRLASQRRLLKFSLGDLVPHEQVIQNMKGAPDINRPEENQGGGSIFITGGGGYIDYCKRGGEEAF